MGFMDKAKELAAKAETAIGQFDTPSPTKAAEGLFRDLGALIFAGYRAERPLMQTRPTPASWESCNRSRPRPVCRCLRKANRPLRHLPALLPRRHHLPGAAAQAPPPPGAAPGATTRQRPLLRPPRTRLRLLRPAGRRGRDPS